MSVVSTQPLTEMSTRNLPWGKGRPAHKADNLSRSCSKCASLDASQSYGPPRPVTGIWLSSRTCGSPRTWPLDRPSPPPPGAGRGKCFAVLQCLVKSPDKATWAAAKRVQVPVSSPPDTIRNLIEIHKVPSEINYVNVKR
jgi:hypothetical protein